MAKLKRQPGGTEGATQDAELEQRLVGTRFGKDKVSEGAYVMLYRMDDVKKRWVYHGRLQPEEYTEDYIAARFGGGQWRGQLKENNGKGVFEITATDSFDLPGEYREPSDLPGAPKLKGKDEERPVVGQLGADGKPMSATEALNLTVVSQAIETIAKMREVQGTPTSVLAEIAAIVTAISPIVEKFVAQKKDAPSPMEMVKEIAAMLKAMAPPPPPPPPAPSPLAEVTKAMRELMGIKDMISEPKAPEEPADVMTQSLPKILEYLAAAASGRAPKVEQPAPAQPQQLPAGDVPANINQLLPWQQILHRQKRSLLNSAQMGVEADFAAEVAIRYMPQNIVGYVREFLLMPDHLDKVFNTIPELRNFETWTRDFFAAAKDMFFQDEGEEEDEVEDEAPVPPTVDEVEAARRRPRRPRRVSDDNGAA